MEFEIQILNALMEEIILLLRGVTESDVAFLAAIVGYMQHAGNAGARLRRLHGIVVISDAQGDLFGQLPILGQRHADAGMIVAERFLFGVG